MIAICITFILGIAYVLFAYDQTSADIKSKQQLLFLQKKTHITKAFQQYHQFLSFIESRLVNVTQNQERIIPILSLNIEHLIEGPFPNILSLTFILASTSKIEYSRFGKTLLSHKVKSENVKAGITYLEKGKFT
jgi:hypothetical protein